MFSGVATKAVAHGFGRSSHSAPSRHAQSTPRRTSEDLRTLNNEAACCPRLSRVKLGVKAAGSDTHGRSTSLHCLARGEVSRVAAQKSLVHMGVDSKRFP